MNYKIEQVAFGNSKLSRHVKKRYILEDGRKVYLKTRGQETDLIDGFDTLTVEKCLKEGKELPKGFSIK